MSTSGDDGEGAGCFAGQPQRAGIAVSDFFFSTSASPRMSSTPGCRALVSGPPAWLVSLCHSFACPPDLVLFVLQVEFSNAGWGGNFLFLVQWKDLVTVAIRLQLCQAGFFVLRYLPVQTPFSR